jgi:hypothetical protein
MSVDVLLVTAVSEIGETPWDELFRVPIFIDTIRSV